MGQHQGESIEYWKQNAEEDYNKTPISVLKYISVLETEVVSLSSQLCQRLTEINSVEDNNISDKDLNSDVMNYQRKSEIYEKAKRIIASDLSWKKKFEKIFSDEISDKVPLDYYDPDTTYEEDVLAYMRAFDEHMIEQKMIQDQIGD